MLLEGIFLPLTTPFYPDGRVYLKKLEHNVARYSKTSAAGLLVLASSGESDGLTDGESRAILSAAMGAAEKNKVMLAAIGRESVFATLAMADAAASDAYDVAVVRGPAYSADPAMIVATLTFFRAVADRSPLPIVLLSDFERPLETSVITELAEHPNILGVIDDLASPNRLLHLRKDTAEVSHEVTVTTVFAAVTGRMLNAVAPKADQTFVSAESLGGGGTALAVATPQAVLKTRVRKVGFQVLCGSTAWMLDAWFTGAAGAVPRLGACAPQACCEVWQAFRDGDLQLARGKQERLESASLRMEGRAGIAALKYGCDLNGYFGGRPRLPLIGLTATERLQLEEHLSGLRN